MRILGIDCGSKFTGYGLIESDGARHQWLESGVLATNPGDAFPLRLYSIGSRLRALVARLQPDEAAVEDTFQSVNARSALKLTHVRGVVLFVLAEAGLRVGEYPPAQVKLAVAGNGRAPKEQVAWMIGSLLRLTTPIESADESDALAVAVCHATHRALGAAQ